MDHPGCHEKQCHEQHLQEEHIEQHLQEEHIDHLVQTTAELANELETRGEVRVWGPDSKLFADTKGVKREDGSVSVVDLRRSLISRLFNPYDFQSRITKK